MSRSSPSAPADSGPTRERDSLGLLGLGLTVILALMVLPPVGVLLQGGLSRVGPDGSSLGWTLAHYRDLLGRDSSRLLFNSVVFAAGSAVLSLLSGGLLAWLVERTNTPFRGLAYLTTFVSMGTPYVLYVTAWLYLLGRAGPLNSLYRALGGSNDVLVNVYSLPGMILVEGFLWSPLAFLLLGATFRAANADMEEAARVSGAGVLATVRRITLPMVKPAVLALALFVFVRNLEAFEVPALVGLPGGVRVLTTDIFLSIREIPPDLGHASAFSTVLLAAVAVLLVFYGRLSKNAERFQSITGKGFRPRPFDLGGWRAVAGALVLANFALVMLLPMLALIWIATQPFMRPLSLAGFRSWTLDNFRAVLGAPHYLELVLNTLLASAGAAVAVMAAAFLGGWLAARRRPFGDVIDQLMTMPLVFPGIVLGVAVLQITLRLPLPLYGTLWAIGLAFTIRYLPYGMRYAYAGTLQIHQELEEAAGVAGASSWNVLRRVVAPLLSPALVAAGLFVFLLGAKELSMAILLASPTSQTIAVAMFDLWVNGQSGELAALGLLWTAALSAVVGVFYSMALRRGFTVTET